MAGNEVKPTNLPLFRLHAGIAAGGAGRRDHRRDAALWRRRLDVGIDAGRRTDHPARPRQMLAQGLVAFSRVYLGAHYPGDVISGSLAGTVLARLYQTAIDTFLRAKTNKTIKPPLGAERSPGASS